MADISVRYKTTSSLIMGTAYADNIGNGGSNNKIYAGDGDDTIQSTLLVYETGIYSSRQANGFRSSINAGKGNDEITSLYNNAIFLYANGDGNDTIWGFDTTSTLNIAARKYSTKRSGTNVIVTVGDGKITLKGAASLSKRNIVTIPGGGSSSSTSGGGNYYYRTHFEKGHGMTNRLVTL